MKWLVLIMSLPLILLTTGLLLNRPPLLSAPGPLERLKTYLTRNVAETRTDHIYPELRTPLVPVAPGHARDAVLAAMRKLGWREINETQGEVRAVVVSSFLRFRDDVAVWFEETGGGTLLHARSASRVGKGDLAANARHLGELFAAVKLLVLERAVQVAAPRGAR